MVMPPEKTMGLLECAFTVRKPAPIDISNMQNSKIAVFFTTAPNRVRLLCD